MGLMRYSDFCKEIVEEVKVCWRKFLVPKEMEGKIEFI